MQNKTAEQIARHEFASRAAGTTSNSGISSRSPRAAISLAAGVKRVTHTHTHRHTHTRAHTREKCRANCSRHLRNSRMSSPDSRTLREQCLVFVAVLTCGGIICYESWSRKPFLNEF